jgi:hypothetical protein
MSWSLLCQNGRRAWDPLFSTIVVPGATLFKLAARSGPVTPQRSLHERVSLDRRGCSRLSLSMSDLHSEALGIEFQNYDFRLSIAFKRVLLLFRIEKIPGSNLFRKLAVPSEDFPCFPQSLHWNALIVPYNRQQSPHSTFFRIHSHSFLDESTNVYSKLNKQFSEKCHCLLTIALYMLLRRWRESFL